MAKLVFIVHGPYEGADRRIRDQFLPAVKALSGLRTIDYAPKPNSSAGVAPEAVIVLTFESMRALKTAVALSAMKRAIDLISGAGGSGGLTSLIYETKTMYSAV